MNLTPSKFIISPDSLMKSSWDLFMFFLILWQAVVIPYRLCFDINANDNKAMSGIEATIDILFACDILFCLNTGFYKGGILVMN